MIRWHDSKGRTVCGEWYDSPLGRAALRLGEVFLWVGVACLLAWCVASAADVMPLRCSGVHCARVAP